MLQSSPWLQCSQGYLGTKTASLESASVGNTNREGFLPACKANSGRLTLCIPVVVEICGCLQHNTRLFCFHLLAKDCIG